MNFSHWFHRGLDWMKLMDNMHINQAYVLRMHKCKTENGNSLYNKRKNGTKKDTYIAKKAIVTKWVFMYNVLITYRIGCS